MGNGRNGCDRTEACVLYVRVLGQAENRLNLPDTVKTAGKVNDCLTELRAKVCFFTGVRPCGWLERKRGFELRGLRGVGVGVLAFVSL